MFYRPGKDDNGLPHDPFKVSMDPRRNMTVRAVTRVKQACVMPRAIGWISTVSGDALPLMELELRQ